MKALKTKVLLSAFVLLFALVATIGSTYAWFTVSNTVTVSSFQLNVISTDSLLFKLAAYTAVDSDAAANNNPAVGYSTAVTIDQTTLTAATGYGTMADWRLGLVTAVQPGYATVSANPTALLGLVTDQSTNPLRALSGAPTINTGAGGVIQLKFWVMSQASAAKDLYLSTFTVVGNTAFTTVNTALNGSVRMSAHTTAGTDYIYGNSGTIDYGFEFLNTNATTYYAGAIYNGTLGLGGNATLALGFNKIDDLIQGLTPVAGEGTALTAAALAPLSVGTLLVASAITSLAQNTPQLVTCTIYIDGWDSNATNLLNTATFTLTFKFSI